jgi:hypothetical protein
LRVGRHIPASTFERAGDRTRYDVVYWSCRNRNKPPQMVFEGMTTKQIQVFTTALAALLAGCAAPLPVSPDEAWLAGPVTPVRAYLSHGSSPPLGYAGYGYLVFTAYPSEASRERNEHICDAFHRNLVETWSRSASERHFQMVTYWLVHAPSPSSELNCRDLVRHYDYARASTIASAVRRQASAGPLLIAWSNPFELSSSEEALVFDLSDFDNEDLDRAFAIWRDRVTRDPRIWRDGFQIITMREACRSLIQRYGQDILAVIHPKKA